MADSMKSDYPLITKLGLLEQSHVMIQDKQKVENSLRTLINGGFDNLQVIADFDHTLTRFHLDGDRCDTSWGILDNAAVMGKYYRGEAKKLFEKYYPIEVDPYMKEEEKIPHIIEWYDKIQELLEKSKLEKKSLENLVSSSNCHFRDGAAEVMLTLCEKNVPFLVLSAGMGDVVEHVLRHFHLYTKNVKVVSNFFKYDENGVMIGFEGDMIHVFNKNENALHSSDYFKILESRGSVLLLGDSLGDSKMASGVPPNSDVLKIGFLNTKVDASLETYMKTFDIVLVDDQSMNLLSSLISELQ